MMCHSPLLSTSCIAWLALLMSDTDRTDVFLKKASPTAVSYCSKVRCRSYSSLQFVDHPHLGFKGAAVCRLSRTKSKNKTDHDIYSIPPSSDSRPGTPENNVPHQIPILEPMHQRERILGIHRRKRPTEKLASTPSRMAILSLCLHHSLHRHQHHDLMMMGAIMAVVSSAKGLL